MAENVTMKELVRLGRETSSSQIHFYVACERYRRAKLFQKDGYKIWSAALDALIQKIRRSRSGIMAKLAQVRLLIDSSKISFEQLEKIGDANATLLCRLYRAGKMSAEWIQRAQTWEVERFKVAVLKVVKPKEEPRRRLTFVVVQSLFVEIMSMIGRIQTLAKLKTKEGVLEFVVADYLTRDDLEILHQASEDPKTAERLAQVRQLELENTSKNKDSTSKRSKDGFPSTTKTPKPSNRSANGRTLSDSETSSVSVQDGVSASCSAAQEATTHGAS